MGRAILVLVGAAAAAWALAGEPVEVGYISSAANGTAVVVLAERTLVRVGDWLTARQYGEDVARLRVDTLRGAEAVCRVVAVRPGAVLRALDAVFGPVDEGVPAGFAEVTAQAATLPTEGEAIDPGSGEVIPRPHWTYGALSLLAVNGCLPNTPAWWFHGDRLLTREDVRRILSTATTPDPSSPSALAYVMLSREYGAGPAPPSDTPILARNSYTRLRYDNTELEHGWRLLSRRDFLFRVGENAFGVLTLTSEHREWQGVSKGFHPVDTALISTQAGGVHWDIGKTYLRWGPSYSGALLLGDEAQGLPLVRAKADLKLGRMLGRWTLDQFIAGFREGGENHYLFGRRLQKDVTSRLSFAIAETMKARRMPNPSVFVLPVLAYQRIFDRDSNDLNALLEIDLRYRGPRLETYGELLIDDITAPRGFGAGYRVRRKIGYTVGVRQPGLWHGGRSDLRIEYVSIDRETYLHRNFAVSYYRQGRILGHPLGPNGRGLLVRVDRRLGRRSELVLTGWREWQSNPGPPAQRRTDSILLTSVYEVTRRSAVSLSVGPIGVRQADGTRVRSMGLEFVFDHTW
ncbi:MAG: capsule assembly Wzi family protein [Armatimonadota bacterium]